MAGPRNEKTTFSRREAAARRDRTDNRQESAGPDTTSIESMIQKIGIDKVYGSPVTQGDTTVIPVADLRTGFGYGGGHDPSEGGEGSGGGAGLRLTARGYIEITPNGVRYRPIYDLGPLVLGGAFVGWLAYRLFTRGK